MIKPAVEILRYVGPLLVAIKRQNLEGKSQKDIAITINKRESWVSRRIKEAFNHKLVEISKEQRSERRGWGFVTWSVNVISLTQKGHEAVETIENLDPVLVWCPNCREKIDVTGFSGLISCPCCGYEFCVEGIDPQVHILPILGSTIDVFVDAFLYEMEDDKPGKTGVLGMPLGPVRRLGWSFLKLR